MTSVRPDPVATIMTELAASNPVARLAARLEAGRTPGIGGSILANQLSAIEDAERLRTRFPTYSRSFATDQVLEKLATHAANPDIAELRQLVMSAGAMADELAKIDRAIGEALEGHLAKLLADTAAGMSAHLARRNFRAEALGLLEDIGLGGKLSDDQVTALVTVLEEDANKLTTACQSVAASGKLDVVHYFAMLAENAKEGLAALERLREHFQVRGP